MLHSPVEIISAAAIGLVLLVLIRLLQQPAYEPLPQPPQAPSSSLSPSPLLPPTGMPYNEEITVDLITEWYSLLISLAYLYPTQVVYPPHNINERLCKSLGIDDVVISLMKKIPYIDGPYVDVQKREGLDEGDTVYGCHLFPGSMGYSFLRDDDIVESRDPENGGVGGVRLNHLLSHDVALSHCLRDGMILILDTKANTVRILDNNDGFDNPDDFVLEIPSEPDHYRNCHPQDAPSYFRQLIEKVRSLQLIPNGPSRSDKEFYGYDTGFEDRDEAKKILTERYGWPDDFRQEDWARDAEEIWGQIQRDVWDKIQHES
ncbi:hypothetical protein DL95DRAFT_522518 [Leptodontidium sp. 2 PMI_412]|nr:hypothetical protein DL95DRAFT_522518 [Leptodontidium sp. 2 PMI_412]